MAHGLNSVLKRVSCKEGKAGIGSRRIFAPHFKLQVLDSYRNDADCKGNQRATARKYGIHRRQIQKWLQVENNLRNSVKKSARQPDDDAPTIPTAPLDFTTRPKTPDPAPIDLSLKKPEATVWDLSTKPKIEQPKPVKLFKPYLDDIEEKRPEPTPPCCTYYYNNNNNNNDTYTLLELQPTTTNYYYTYPSYEMNFYEDPNYLQNSTPLKQRHSYSLDFKLSAIECYYQDSVCKGNQRAVATKYNIHRRQVQKWLKQADELKQKNETIKTQIVR